MPGTLYIVATPIGNLEDLSLRAARVLGQVMLVAAEDTRVTRKLLSHLGVRVPIVSYNDHNAARRTPRILGALAEGDVALVSDAGSPAVSDPGSALVRVAAEIGFTVSPIPGPSAVTAALAVAGLMAKTFRFLGFPPRGTKARITAFETAGASTDPLVFFESPRRVRTTLAAVRDVLGERRIIVCRELTKLHEEIWRGTPSEAIAHFAEPRGEFTVVIEAAPTAAARVPVADDVVRERLSELMAEGLTRRYASAQAARELGRPRREVYGLWPG